MADLPIKTDAPSTARMLDYAQPLSWRDRARRYLPAGSQVAAFLKSLVWVAPLTLLIWVYAEREQSVVQPGITVPVEVATNDPKRQVTLRKPADRLIIVELSGPRERMDRVREMLKPTPSGAPLKINVDPKLGLGGQELQTIGAINELPLFKNAGITVKSAQPPFLVVDIDEYEEREVQVRPPPDAAKLLTEQTRFVPANVYVRAPSQVIKAAEAAGQLFAYADLAKRDEWKSKPGTKQPLDNVGVYWPFAKENVTLSPSSVTANLDVKLNDRKFTIASLPVYLEAPAGLTDQFSVKYQSVIPNVNVTGPDDQIELIRKGEFKPKARLEVSTFDPTNKTLTRALRVDLPPNVALFQDATAERMQTWEFKIVERER